jgi:hypothetical protein
MFVDARVSRLAGGRKTKPAVIPSSPPRFYRVITVLRSSPFEQKLVLVAEAMSNDLPAVATIEPELDHVTPSHEEIERVAYLLWLTRGRPLGSPDEDWRNAERRLRERAGERNQASEDQSWEV